MFETAFRERRPQRAGLLVSVVCLGMACNAGTIREGAETNPVMVRSADGTSLGTVVFETSCEEDAQEALERGLALLHHMTYVESHASFGRAAEVDPECAIAYWGQAMTYVHPLWPDTLSDGDHARGRELLERAAAAAHRSERETSYVHALNAYYEPDYGARETERLNRFLDGFRRVHDRFPEDPEAKLFYALAQLASAPASDKTYERQRSAGALAESVLQEIPDHPGAHHYVIHAYDVPPLATRALGAARHYGEVAPENSHALHMTSHIFTRVGLWPESITYNQRAADASSERLAGGFLSMHHLHALDYLAYAHLQMADDRSARRVLDTLRSLEPPFQNHAATAYAFAAVPARLALERHDWEAATAVPTRWPEALPWDEYPHLEAIATFAIALGAAKTGRLDEARKAIERLDALQERAKQLNMAYDWEVQVEIQRKAAEGWLAQAEGDAARALALLEEASDLEASTEKNPVTPGEVLPASELYGDLLMENEMYQEARQQYEGALERSPNRFRSTYGAGRASELGGDAEAASDFYRRLLDFVDETGGERAELSEVRTFLNAS